MMMHPSYLELIDIANKGVEEGEEPVVTSRYSIILAAARRARQLVDGAEPVLDGQEGNKPLSIAVNELFKSQIHILPPSPEDLLDDEPGEELRDAISSQSTSIVVAADEEEDSDKEDDDEDEDRDEDDEEEEDEEDEQAEEE